MADAQLLPLIEPWLRAATRGFGIRLRFPAALEARFEADTRRERSRLLGTIGAFGVLVGLALFPALVAAMPDRAVLCWRLYLETSLAIGGLTAGLMWFEPGAWLREAAQWFSNTINALVVTYLFATSRVADPSLYAAGVIALIVYSTLAIPLRFRFACATVAALLGLFAFDMLAASRLAAPVRQDLLLIAWAVGGFALIANWRLELLLRRSYLLLLRERLRRAALTARNQELDLLARRDPLTALANRRAYDLWLAQHWEAAAEQEQPLGLVVLDIDRFKSYNDCHGHPGGDRCLQAVARTLADQLRETSDLVARVGGEEFAVLLPGLAAETCADIAERLRVAVVALDLPHLGGGGAGRVTVSAGVASLLPGPGLRAPDLFAAADTALYAAKASGRNRVCIGQVAVEATV